MSVRRYVHTYTWITINERERVRRDINKREGPMCLLHALQDTDGSSTYGDLALQEAYPQKYSQN